MTLPAPASPRFSLPFPQRLALVLLLVNLLVFLFAGWTVYQDRLQHQAKAEITVQNLSLVLDRSISASIDKIGIMLGAAQAELEQQIRAGGLSEKLTNPYLSEAARQLPEVAAFRAADADGKVRWGVTPGSVYTASDRDYFLALRDDPRAGMVISRPILGRVTGKWMIFFAKRLNDAQGRFAGIVFAGVETAYFSHLFSTLNVGPHGLIALRNDEHALISRVPMIEGQEIGNTTVSATYRELTARQPLSGKFVGTNASDGLEKLFYFRKTGAYPLYVTVAQANVDVYSGWRDDAFKTGALALLFLLMTCTGGYFLYDSWRRQEKLAASLEQRVLERTAALANANDELRRASQQLIQSEKLSALGSLVAGVAHELNTPIGNMRLTASSLAGRVQEFVQESAQGSMKRSQLQAFSDYCGEAVGLIDRAAVRAGELIQSFKQIAVDQTSLRRRRFDLRQTVEQTVVALTPLLKRTPYVVDVEIAAGLEIDGYPGPLEQVITNLVTNSLAHAFEGRSEGRMRISAQSVADGGDGYELVYSDDGNGIPDEIVARVFDPFFTTKLGQGGSGLGLYTVYNIVTGILGGTVRLEGRPGRGVRFAIILPRVSPAQSAENTEETA